MHDSLIDIEDLDLASLLRSGDRIVCAQTCAEPLTLTRDLMQAAARAADGWNIFLGTTMSDTFEGTIPQGLRFTSYGAIGRTAALADLNLLDVVTERYSRLPGLFERGSLRADVVLLQLAPGADGQPPSLGLANDYAATAARSARVVIAEINEHTPWTHGAQCPADLRITHRVRARFPPAEMAPQPHSIVNDLIARHIAERVPDGATLQVGVGALPDTSLRNMKNHRHLGFHSGVLGDAAMELILCGAISNERKGADAGISVTNTASGTRALYGFLHRNPAVEVRHTRRTHDAAVLRGLKALHAINGALQVDLGGQANCEQVAGKQRGGIGGLLDFARAARDSEGGCSILVLPATADGGRTSRIVRQLDGPATLGRADADVVITEHGIADLRDVTLDERARRLVAIAAPQFRARLARGGNA